MEIEVGSPAESRAAALRAGSRSLGGFLEGDEGAGRLLVSDEPLPADYGKAIGAAFSSEGIGGLRLEKRRRLLALAARDLAGELSLEEVGAGLAALADACLQVVLGSLEAGNQLSVISMGKLGGRELNYSSDIDLLFLTDEDIEVAIASAEDLISALGAFAPESQAFRIDLNLRPEGRQGALVRSLDGYREYYKRWAEPWEYQALIKARPAAGKEELGAAFLEITSPFVYAQNISEERVVAIRRMKERVETHAQRSARRSKTSDAKDVKLGPGGIRDIEFSVQLLQLVHGGSDASVRSPTTLDALHALVAGGYVAEDDGAGLEVAYRWLRNVEHRLQLWQERQTHHLPTDPDALSRVGRVMGFKDSPAMAAGERFEQAHKSVLADVRARFEKLFYRPMIASLGEASGGSLSKEALNERLRVLGFRDADRAARTLEGLVGGTSRRAKLLRVLTPAMLRFLTATPMPDQGLFSFLQLSEALSDRLDVLGSMRDNPAGLAVLARVLGSGRFLGDVLTQVPEEVAAIADARDVETKDRERLVRESIASLEWRGPDRLLEGLRRFKRRETLRVALADVSGKADGMEVGRVLTDVAEACLEAALQGAGVPFAVIAMGKLGGRELGYASDIDVMFVYDGDPSAGERIAEELMKAIGEVTPEGQAFRIDAGLRPEGKAGPLARSVESYLEYYTRWAKTWEHQALIKARVAAGDKELGERLVMGTRDLAFPARLSPSALVEIRHLKARMERERIPKGTDPRRNLKLGPGGLSDIEFAAQVIQLAHGRSAPELQVSGTIDAISGARATGSIDEPSAGHLIESYCFLLATRNRLFFLHARPTDALPNKPEDLEALGIAMGFDKQPRQELEETYLRLTRRARKVCEGIIFGRPGEDRSN